ncbi:phage regulatory CII family protein [Vibrio neptunius]|uniref:phage regulatory CII family protein n=1 Tax=Vibrio neptunius TaxID=170651 RepID=UPI003CE4DDD4
MNESDSMYEFVGTNQWAFNEACWALARSENMTKLAERIGMSPTIRRNKLNSEQPHVLSGVEFIAITKVSGNHTRVNNLFLGLGVVTAHIPCEASEETFIKRALENSILSGDLAQMALVQAASSRLSRANQHNIIQKAQASIGNLVLLMSDLEERTQGVSPFFAMGLDFVANGAPVSGFS